MLPHIPRSSRSPKVGTTQQTSQHTTALQPDTAGNPLHQHGMQRAAPVCIMAEYVTHHLVDKPLRPGGDANGAALPQQLRPGALAKALTSCVANNTNSHTTSTATLLAGYTMPPGRLAAPACMLRIEARRQPAAAAAAPMTCASGPPAAAAMCPGPPLQPKAPPASPSVCHLGHHAIRVQGHLAPAHLHDRLAAVRSAV